MFSGRSYTFCTLSVSLSLSSLALFLKVGSGQTTPTRIIHGHHINVLISGALVWC